MNATAKLAIERCSLTFNPGLQNEVRALTDVSVTIPEGQHLVIVGSNGAGKSTLLNLVCGRHLPDAGRISIDGTDITLVPEHVRARRIGRVFQDPTAGTAAPMTIEENLALAERRSLGRRFRRIGRGRSDYYRSQLARLGMGLEDRLSNLVGSLSGGQRQAMALLMATMSEPDVLVLDEHTAALDPGAAERVLQLTSDVIEQDNLTALMITHNMAHALEVGDRTVMMHQGTVLFDVDGDERSALTVEDLIDRFRNLAGTVSDRAALA